MLILLRGHLGYIGAVMAPFLQRAGHEVTDLDTGYFVESVMGAQPEPIPEIRKDLRDVTPEDVYGKSGTAGPLDETAVRPRHALRRKQGPRRTRPVRVGRRRFRVRQHAQCHRLWLAPRLRTDIVLNDLVAWAFLTGEVKVLSDGTPVAANRAYRV